MVIVVMGPAGSGKSTVGAALARALGWGFLDADSLHSADNVARIRSGHPLTDAERAPWLEAIAREIAVAGHDRLPLVIACSALRRAYRDLLRAADAQGAIRFVYLKVSASELARRLRSRANHYAPPELLTSQLATLEEPTTGEANTFTVNGGQSVADVVAAVRDVAFRNTA